MKKLFILFGLSLAFTLSSQQAFAVVLPPGFNTTATPDVLVNPAVVPGASLVATATVPFTASSSNGSFSGSLTEDVWRIGGTLTFTYQFSNAGPDAISTLSTTGFGPTIPGTATPMTTDVGYAALTGTSLPPDSVTRTANGNIHFDWNAVAGVGTSQTSPVLIIATNATNYNHLAQVILHNGAFTSPLSGFEPAVAPEPTSLALLGGAFVGIAGAAWRRRQAGVKTV